jgi:hypothetical protein
MDVQEKQYEKLGVVVCYFNPSNYISKFVNFLDFYYKIKNNTNICLQIVESYSNDSVYPLKNTISKNIISIKSESVYWQKEELINIGMRKQIESGIKKLCWLDCDIEFIDCDWTTTILEKLDTNDIVQVFSDATIITDSRNNKIQISSYIKKNLDEGCNPMRRIGEIGYGYAYNHTIIKDYMLYENAIIGSGDFLNALPFLENISTDDIKKDRYFKNATSDMVFNYLNWYEQIKNKNIGYCKNKIKVAFHGNREDRQYLRREKILMELNYRPSIDLVKSDCGLRRIVNKKIEKYLKKYFNERNEDVFMNSIVSKRFFNNTLNRVILNADISVDKTDTMLQKIDKIKNLSNDTQRNTGVCFLQKKVAVWSKNNLKDIKTKTIPTIHDIVYDKSNRPQCESIRNNKNDRLAHTYLRYIIDNYHMLSDVTFFLNDHINQRNVLQTLKKIQNIADNEKQSYTPIVHAESKVETDELGHIVGLYSNVNIIKSNYTFQEWNNIVLGKQSSEFTYQKFPCFYVGKHYIQNNPIELYKKLLDLTLSDSYMNEEELYLNKSWKHLLK